MDAKRCQNFKCKTRETPLWRKGWKTSNGGRVRLCNACGLHFRKSHYCKYCFEIYRDSYELEIDSSPWVSCKQCEHFCHLKCLQNAGENKDAFICVTCKVANQAGSLPPQHVSSTNSSAVTVPQTHFQQYHYQPPKQHPTPSHAIPIQQQKHNYYNAPQQQAYHLPYQQQQYSHSTSPPHIYASPPSPQSSCSSPSSYNSNHAISASNSPNHQYAQQPFARSNSPAKRVREEQQAPIYYLEAYHGEQQFGNQYGDAKRSRRVSPLMGSSPISPSTANHLTVVANHESNHVAHYNQQIKYASKTRGSASPTMPLSSGSVHGSSSANFAQYASASSSFSVGSSGGFNSSPPLMIPSRSLLEFIRNPAAAADKEPNDAPFLPLHNGSNYPINSSKITLPSIAEMTMGNFSLHGAPASSNYLPSVNRLQMQNK